MNCNLLENRANKLKIVDYQLTKKQSGMVNFKSKDCFNERASPIYITLNP